MPKNISRPAIGLSLIIYSLAPVVADANETVTYSYDELGRLTRNTKSGGPASGVQTTTSYDRAGNRLNQATTGVRILPAQSNSPAMAGVDSEPS